MWRALSVAGRNKQLFCQLGYRIRFLFAVTFCPAFNHCCHFWSDKSQPTVIFGRPFLPLHSPNSAIGGSNHGWWRLQRRTRIEFSCCQDLGS